MPYVVNKEAWEWESKLFGCAALIRIEFRIYSFFIINVTSNTSGSLGHGGSSCCNSVLRWR
jgi:hypothetical protein